MAVARGDGRVLLAAGDIDRPFFIRSAAKPFQAQTALEAGAPLDPIRVALACASHSGDPVHVALVSAILEESGLDDSALQCPPARPAPAADRRLAATGDVRAHPRYHNCSGKHAAMLVACVAAGWATDTYLDPGHPLQQATEELMAEVSGMEVGPPGVDGCGAPVWRTTVRAMSHAYARLSGDSRLSAVRTAMARYPLLVSGEGRADALIGRWLGVPSKGGAAGCLGVSPRGHGVAAKAWSGNAAAAGVGVMAGLSSLGVVSPAMRRELDHVAAPVVRGGGAEVGRMRSTTGLVSV